MLIYGAKLGDLVGDKLTIHIPLNTVQDMRSFRPDDLVTVEIKRPKDKRTLGQNRYIWEIISQIAKKVNGYLADDLEIYKEIIREAKIKTIFIQTVEEAKNILSENFRIIEEVEKRQTEKGTSIVFRCYIGTSQFTKEEMSDFIEVLINRAYREGIDVHHYEEILRGK